MAFGQIGGCAGIGNSGFCMCGVAQCTRKARSTTWTWRTKETFGGPFLRRLSGTCGVESTGFFEFLRFWSWVHTVRCRISRYSSRSHGYLRKCCTVLYTDPTFPQSHIPPASPSQESKENQNPNSWKAGTLHSVAPFTPVTKMQGQPVSNK